MKLKPFLFILSLCVFLQGCSLAIHLIADAPTDNKKFPIKDVYYIRTRIVLEQKITPFLGQNLVQTSTNAKRIQEEIKTLEYIYKDMGIKLYVERCDTIKQLFTRNDYFKDSENYKDFLSIYYRLPGGPPELEDFEGMADFPWYKLFKNYSVIILNFNRDNSCLSHEIGHIFGLIHTFEYDDLCDDTPTQKYPCMLKHSANCGNIMNYCIHWPKYLTKDQIKRANLFLHTKKSNLVIPNEKFEKELNLVEFLQTN